MTNHAPSAVVMVRPHHFTPNPETAEDNTFQSDITNDVSDIAGTAFREVTIVAEQLESIGIEVHLFEDETHETPDSVFPNNWFSTHQTGEIILYPMYAPNRRLERREDIISDLIKHYKVESVTDWSFHEIGEHYLEGTGAIVFDHEHRLAYAVRSNRCDEALFNKLCQHLDYRPVCFSAIDRNGRPVYHTNVIMTVGSDYVTLATNMIKSDIERQQVLATINATGKELIELSETQIEQFCGNTFELQSKQGESILVISNTAMAALQKDQIERLQTWVKLLPMNVKTIELAGGSIRCMLAGIYLKKRPV